MPLLCWDPTTRHLMNVLHIPKPYFCKVSLNIIIASTPGYSFQGFQYKNFHAFFIATTCPAHLIPCDMITAIIFCEDWKLWISSCCFLLSLQSYVLLSTLFWNTFNLWLVTTIVTSTWTYYVLRFSITFNDFNNFIVINPSLIVSILCFTYSRHTYNNTCKIW